LPGAVFLNDHLATLKLQSERKMATGAIHIDIQQRPRDLGSDEYG